MEIKQSTQFLPQLIDDELSQSNLLINQLLIWVVLINQASHNSLISQIKMTLSRPNHPELFVFIPWIIHITHDRLGSVSSVGCTSTSCSSSSSSSWHSSSYWCSAFIFLTSRETRKVVEIVVSVRLFSLSTKVLYARLSLWWHLGKCFIIPDKFLF